MTEASTESVENCSWYEILPYAKTWFGFCTSSASYDQCMHLNKVPNHTPGVWLKHADGGMMSAFRTVEGRTVYLVSVDLIYKPGDPVLAALLAHECIHAVQALWTDIGEEYPGREAEAYLLQYMLQFCLERYAERYAKKKKTKVAHKAYTDPVNLTQD